MTQNSDSNDRYMAALDFIMTFLRDHEAKLDMLSNHLGEVVAGIGGFEVLSKKLDNLSKETDLLEKELASLAAMFHNREHQHISTSQ